MSDDLRVPPHNEDAERSLLGAVMLDNDLLDTVASKVSPEDFYREAHRHVFQGMIDLRERKEHIDAVTLGDHLSAEDKLEAVGGASFLTRLSNEVPSAANAEHYLEIVRKKSTLRRFLATAGELVEEGYSDVSDVDDFLDTAEQEIFTVTQEGVTKDYRSMKDVIKEAVDELETLYDRDERITGVPSGFVDLDELTGGWQESDLIIVAGRPGMGKTALSLNMAAHAAVERNVPTAFFSLEMSSKQLAIRMLCSEARVDQSNVRRGILSEKDWEKLLKATGEMNDADLFLDDTPALSIMEFRSKCRRLRAEEDIGVVFIDYLQLMQASGDHDIREQEISEISRSLKGIAKELGIPVVALAQLNRGVESRSDKRPKLRDLRESGAIEQDADVISFIYRDEVYNDDVEEEGITEVILGKHRNGPVGTVELKFFKEHTRFENLSRR
ncbi:MAG: replicative DNA helicase [Bradymonadaceae bacterium]